MTREQLFLSQLPVIERVIGWVCARRCLRGADAEDFASTVKCRLIEDDYEILGKFGGRSSLKTYLTVVINRLYLDFQVQRFGKVANVGRGPSPRTGGDAPRVPAVPRRPHLRRGMRRPRLGSRGERDP